MIYSINSRKITFIVISIFIILIFSFCSSSKYTTFKDEKGKNIIIGNLTWSEWKKEAGWNSYSATNTEFDGLKIKLLAKFVNPGDYSFKLFGGSWCGDSESQMPIIYKLFEKAGISNTLISLYGLDRDKKEPSGEAQLYNIERVPTFIVLLKNKEIGRIVEYPAKSWEDDLLKIILEKSN